MWTSFGWFVTNSEARRPGRKCLDPASCAGTIFDRSAHACRNLAIAAKGAGDGVEAIRLMALERDPSPLSLESSGGQRPTEAETSETDEIKAITEVVPEPIEEKQDIFFVVGVGASAGGLEAVGDLIKQVPFECMAFVVVQHLAPDHESILTQLLARSSKTEVLTAAEGMKVEPGHVYVIPQNTDLALLHGVLHLLAPPGSHGPRLPIDFFFRSLADDRGSSAIGIILSGTGTDGTFGLKAIKAAGGLTFVQEPSSAKYDGMPRSALASGYADFCLPPKGIANELARLGKQRPLLGSPVLRLPGPLVQEQLAKLFVLIRAKCGNDLSYYKPSTVERRIERRMMLHKIERIDDYVKYVQSNPEELPALYNDMLITVTSFFRDRAPFEVLKSHILPQILEHKEPGAPIRVWVPACATGEEAYSIAICLFELLEEKSLDAKIQIFATDVDDDSVKYARSAVYPQNIAADVSPERLNRFFVKKDNDYQICRRVRDAIVLSKQNLLKDAPFSRIDLVSCRNLLIYLQPAAQKKALRILHYSLNPFGVLLLGTSETVGDAPDLFSLIDRKNKFYSRKHVASVAPVDVGFQVHGTQEAISPASAACPTPGLQGLADRKVLELYGPPGVVINETMEILHFRGHTGPYLNPSPGAASFNILRLARPELHIELKRTIQQALAEERRVGAEVTFHEGHTTLAVKLDVVPIHEPAPTSRCLLVLFQTVDPPQDVPFVALDAGQASPELLPLAQRIHQLERELAVTKEYLQTTIDEKESTNEELKSANEELQSANEELQSTNEELETSKEEMQSTNQELTTVNDELESRMRELSQTNDDLHNILAGVGDPVVIIGMDLRIRRFTAAAEKLFALVPADVGRSIQFLDRFAATNLAEKCAAAIASLAIAEEEILCSNQRWYALRITPYKTLDRTIRGAVVIFNEIDAKKRAADLARDVAGYASKFLGAIGHPLLILGAQLRVVWANDPFYKTFRVLPAETIGNRLPDLGTRQWADDRLRELVEETLTTGKIFQDFLVRHRFQEIGTRTMRLGGSRIPLPTETALLLLSIEDGVDALQEVVHEGSQP